MWCPSCVYYDSSLKAVNNCTHPDVETEEFAAVPMSECYRERRKGDQ